MNNTVKKILIAVGLVVASAAPLAAQADSFSLSIGDGGYYQPYYGPRYYAPAPAYYGPAYYGPAYYGPRYYGPRFHGYYGHPGWHGGRGWDHGRGGWDRDRGGWGHGHHR